MVKIDDKVMIIIGKRGQAQLGTVTKTGRAWIEVRPDDIAGDWVYNFRLDDQTNYAGRARFYTLAQWAEHQRNQVAAE